MFLVSTVLQTGQSSASPAEFGYVAGNVARTGHNRYSGSPAANAAHLGHTLSEKHAVHGFNQGLGCLYWADSLL